MRTIEDCINDIKSIYPNYTNPIIGDYDSKRLHDRLNEILKIRKVEKRPKGKWILSGGKYKCSECGEKAKYIFEKSKGGCNEYEPFKSDFCPSCGADMRESEEK